MSLITIKEKTADDLVRWIFYFSLIIITGFFPVLMIVTIFKITSLIFEFNKRYEWVKIE